MSRKTMKRWASMIVILTMVMTFISVPTMAKPMEVYEEPAKTMLYTNDFSTGTANEAWVVNGEIYPNEACMGATEISDGVLKIAPKDSTNGRLTKGKATNTTLTGEYFVEFKFKKSGTSNNNVWRVGTADAGYAFTSDSLGITSAKDIWFNIKIFVDTAEQKCIAWVDGEKKANANLTFGGTHTRIIDVKDVTEAQYYDDLKIYRIANENENEFATTYLVKNFDNALGKNADTAVTTSDTWLTENGGETHKCAAATSASYTTDGWLKVGKRHTMQLSSGNLAKGQYVVEFDFKKEDSATNDPIWCMTNSSEYQYNASITQLDVFPSGLTANQVYKIKLIIDLEKGNISIMVDDKIVKNKTFTVASDHYLNRIMDVTNVTVAQYYDNLRIYKLPVGYQLIASDDFSGYSSDVTYPNGVTTQFLGIQTRSDYDGANIKIDSQNERLDVNNLTGTADTKLMHMYNEYPGKIMVAEFDFTQVVDDDCNYFYQSTHKAGSHTGFGISVQMGDFYYLDKNSGVYLGKCNVGETYKFKIYMDLNKEYNDGNQTRTGSCDIYINDVCVAAGLNPAYTSTDDSNLTDFGRTLISGRTGNHFYMDNMSLYTDVREDIISNISNTLETAYPDGKINDDEITLPTTNVEGYNVTWSTSDENVIDAEGNVTKAATPQEVTLTATVSDTENAYSVKSKYKFVVEPYPSVTVGDFADGKISAIAHNAPEGSAVIIAVYQGDKLKTVKVETVSKTVISATADCSLFEKGNYTAKGFLWKNISTLVPLSESSSEKGFSVGESEIFTDVYDKTLTFSGRGEIEDYSEFSQTPWAKYAEDIEKIQIDSGIVSIGANSLSGFTNLKTIEIDSDVLSIENGALPEGDFTIKGYYNSAAEEYAKENGKEFLLKAIRILSIGNSHTIDYTTWMNDMQNDLYEAGLNTEIEHSTVLYGGRQLYRNDTDRLSHLLVGSDPEQSGYSAYYNKLNQNNKWDLIILQDYHESSRSDYASHFTDGLGHAVEWIKSFQPDAKVAWVMDWAEKASITSTVNTLDNVYENIIGAKNLVDNMTENKPDYIIPMSTAMQNIRTSYLGSVNNAEDAYANYADTDWAWNRDTSNPVSSLSNYTVLERDATHCSYELARYAMGVAVYANIFGIFGEDFDKASAFDFYDALKTAPVRKGTNNEWKGEFTPSIWNIVKESARNSVQNKFTVTQSVYTADPADDIATAIANADYSSVNINDAAALAEKLTQVAENKVTFTQNDISYSEGNVTVTLLYGYTKKTVTIEK